MMRKNDSAVVLTMHWRRSHISNYAFDVRAFVRVDDRYMLAQRANGRSSSGRYRPWFTNASLYCLEPLWCARETFGAGPSGPGGIADCADSPRHRARRGGSDLLHAFAFDQSDTF
jgi:hypothetical protein